jgi:hypothetical protein
MNISQSPTLRVVRGAPVQPGSTLPQWLALVAISLAIGALFAL